eukprot:g3154.t1
MQRVNLKIGNRRSIHVNQQPGGNSSLSLGHQTHNGYNVPMQTSKTSMSTIAAAGEQKRLETEWSPFQHQGQMRTEQKHDLQLQQRQPIARQMACPAPMNFPYSSKENVHYQQQYQQPYGQVSTSHQQQQSYYQHQQQESQQQQNKMYQQKRYLPTDRIGTSTNYYRNEYGFATHEQHRLPSNVNTSTGNNNQQSSNAGVNDSAYRSRIKNKYHSNITFG